MLAYGLPPKRKITLWRMSILLELRGHCLHSYWMPPSIPGCCLDLQVPGERRWAFEVYQAFFTVSGTVIPGGRPLWSPGLAFSGPLAPTGSNEALDQKITKNPV